MSEDQDDRADLPDRQTKDENWGKIEKTLLWRANAVKKMLLAVIALLVFREVVSCLTGLLGALPALLSGMAALAVQIFCSRLAKANLRYYGYLLIPTLIFTVIPAALKLRKMLYFQDKNTAARLWVVAPELIGFVLPVLLLLVAYWIIGRRLPALNMGEDNDTS